MEEWLTNAIECWNAGSWLPKIAATRPDVTLTEAYELQSALLKQIAVGTAGYKAALTAPTAQNHFGLKQPITGVLPKDGAANPDHPIKLVENLKLETEMGFVLARDIYESVTLDSIGSMVSTMLPVIEVARPAIDGSPTAADLIATNSAAYQYIPGKPVPLDTARLDALEVSLLHDDQLLHHERAASVMSGQLDALCWLINQVMGLGLPLRKGQLLITGAIGSIHEGALGSYQAKYGNLGTIDFSIR